MRARVKSVSEFLNVLLVAIGVAVCLVSLYARDVYGLLAGIFLLLVAVWTRLYVGGT